MKEIKELFDLSDAEFHQLQYVIKDCEHLSFLDAVNEILAARNQLRREAKIKKILNGSTNKTIN